MRSTMRIQQISLAAAISAKDPVSPQQIDQATRAQERKTFQASLESSAQTEHSSLVSLYSFSPHPLLLSHQQLLQLKQFNVALSIAITNIVERWWTDEEAGFPLRMPLDPHEDSLLQWVEKATEEKLIPPFNVRNGFWPPDFLLESKTERFLICEINARFPFELLPLAMYGHQALSNIGTQQKLYGPATDPNKVLNDLCLAFDLGLPIHILTGTERSSSLDLFLLLIERQTGAAPNVISFSDLRLVENKHSITGYDLCCLRNHSSKSNGRSGTLQGESLGEIHQIVLQCNQNELLELPQEILRHLALNSVNDMRSIFLVHDKRLLGIILQELNDLVNKHSVLTPKQAHILQEGIAPTIISGSSELEELVRQSAQSNKIKDGFIVKPARLGDNEGIIFGRDLSAEQWTSVVMSLRTLGSDQCIIQHLVNQHVFEIFLHEEKGVQKEHLVGTYHVIDGNFSGLGIWRTGSGRLSSVENGGGSWLVSILSLLG
ncbi:hypothetical protein VN97_g3799 [Penicillium thymicola]|uniref:Uncharacterized protein n=1 Tax=Penicillium thymicola TaxID=293382 RepID=A0AAI9XA74_PENTH|nr:hypothetical protein VN97_g3799 [Penicillium thymicola]